jgi:caffeoyl-CoA O-methyltransferase
MSENNLHQRLDEYVTDLFAREDEALAWIKAETSRHDMPAINLRSFEGRLLQILMYALGARKVVEIGTLAGYSAVWIARALPPGGKLYTLEKSGKHAQVARASFERAGVADRVELLEGAAQDSLRKLAANGPFDLVFIDADKGSYVNYLTWAVENLRPGGMVAAHNAFRNGGVLTPQNDDDRTIQSFNAALAKDTRLESTILAIGDGMAVGIKKSAS